MARYRRYPAGRAARSRRRDSRRARGRAQRARVAARPYEPGSLRRWRVPVCASSCSAPRGTRRRSRPRRCAASTSTRPILRAASGAGRPPGCRPFRAGLRTRERRMRRGIHRLPALLGRRTQVRTVAVWRRDDSAPCFFPRVVTVATSWPPSRTRTAATPRSSTSPSPRALRSNSDSRACSHPPGRGARNRGSRRGADS